MTPSIQMQNVISEIAARHSIDLSSPEAHLRLEQPGFMPLVIENIGPHLLSIAHYYTQNGDVMADPDVVFFTGLDHWIPVEITQSSIGYSRLVTILDDNANVLKLEVQPEEQADLAEFCDMWARNIRDQGWVTVTPLATKIAS